MTSDFAAGPDTRRLTARSVVASALLGVSPPELPTRSLVATAELLGIAPGTARVAMSRMVAGGELAATAEGYRLVGRTLLARRARQELSRQGASEGRAGWWQVAIVTVNRRPAGDRAELRDAMAGLRYAELREGVWLRPDNLPDGVLPDADALVAAQCTLLASRPDEPAALAARLWDLDRWSACAAGLQIDLDQLTPLLDRRDHAALAEGFVVSAAVLRHLQADPLLPATLTSPSWPGPRLRRTHRAYDASFKATLAAWLRTHQPGTA